MFNRCILHTQSYVCAENGSFIETVTRKTGGRGAIDQLMGVCSELKV